MKIYEVRAGVYDEDLPCSQSVWDSTRQEVKPGWATLAEVWIFGKLPEPFHQYPELFELVRNAFKVIWIPEEGTGLIVKDAWGESGSRFKTTKTQVLYWRLRLWVKGRRLRETEDICNQAITKLLVKNWPVRAQA